MELKVEEHTDGATIAVLRGRFDTTGAIAIELPFNALASERPALVADLSDVNFMSSYGIRVLLRAAKIAKSKNARLLIVCPDTAVCKVLQTAGTSDLIPVYPTIAAAMAVLG